MLPGNPTDVSAPPDEAPDDGAPATATAEQLDVTASDQTDGDSESDGGHPVRTPLMAFAVSRALIGAIGLGVSAAGAPELNRALFARSTWQSTIDRFALWDGQWYIAAATRGYGPNGVNPDGQSTAPFFPLLPWMIRGLSKVGLSPTIAGLLVANLAFAVGLCLLYRIARNAGGVELGARATWIAALAPFSVVFSMVYPDGIFFAASIGAFLALRHRRWWLMALCAVIAALARPNGLALILPLGWAIWGERETIGWRMVRIAPLSVAILVVGGWALALGRMTGSSTSFATSKSAWKEIPIWELAARAVNTLTGSGARLPAGLLPHLAVFGLAIAALWFGRSLLERGWLMLSVLALGAPAILGVVGLGRYASGLFPVYVAGAASVEPGSRLERWLLFGAGVAMVVTVAGIFSNRMVP